MTTPPKRVVQAMLIGKYNGAQDDKSPNSLEIFTIPDDEHTEFDPWLNVNNSDLYQKLHQSGFTSLGTRKALAKVAEAYKKTHNPRSRVGWRTVPMFSNSVVLWRGIHRVTNAKRTKDKGCYRTCLYISISEEPPVVELPKTATNENFESSQQGKSPNRSIELAVYTYLMKCKSEGKRFLLLNKTNFHSTRKTLSRFLTYPRYLKNNPLYTN